MSALSVRLTAGGLILVGVASLWVAAGQVTVGNFHMEISRTAPPYVPVGLIALALLLVCVGLCMLIAQEVPGASDKLKAYWAVLAAGLICFGGFGYWLFVDKPTKNVIVRWSYEYGDASGDIMLNTDQLRKYAGRPLIVTARCSRPGSEQLDGRILRHWTTDETGAKVTIPMAGIVSSLRLGDELEYSVYVLPPGDPAQATVTSVGDLVKMGAERLTYRSIDVSISRATPSSIAKLIKQMNPDEQALTRQYIEHDGGIALTGQ